MAVKTVAITSCSEDGTSAAYAEVFAQAGYKVLAAASNTSKLAHLAANPSVKLITLDSSSADSVRHAFEEISYHTNGSLDVLLSDAGESLTDSVLHCDIDDAKNVYDRTLFGALRVTQALAPLVTAAKGTFVYTCAPSPVDGQPDLGVCAGSRSALARMAETLRSEVMPSGARVLTFEAGARASRGVSGRRTRSTPQPQSAYVLLQRQIAAFASVRERAEEELALRQAEQIVREVERRTNGHVQRESYLSVGKLVSICLPSWISIS